MFIYLGHGASLQRLVVIFAGSILISSVVEGTAENIVSQ